MESPSRESPDASIASGELPHGLTIVSEEALAAPAPGGSKLRERARPARTYRKGMIADVPLMLSLRGSALVRTLPWATLAGGYAAVLHTQVGCQVWPSFCANGNPQDGIEGNNSDNDFIFMHTYAYSAILLASGFGLVMRLNQSLGRYWEARSAVQSMASKWCDAILMSAYMDEEADDEAKLREKESAAFARCLLHLGSLLHATAIHTLRCDRSLDSLRARSPSRRPGEQRHQSYTAASWFDGLADDEADFARRNPVDVLGGLEPCERHSLERSTERVHVVLGWLHSLLVKRRKTGERPPRPSPPHPCPRPCATPPRLPAPPRLRRARPRRADRLAHLPGPLGRHAAVPRRPQGGGHALPLRVRAAQRLHLPRQPRPPLAVGGGTGRERVLLTRRACARVGLFPVVVVDKVASLPLAVVISFCSVAFLFGLNEVARDIEDPFTTTLGWTFGANRLDAPLLQAYFDERLLSIASLAGDDLREWPEGPCRYGPFLSMAIGSKAVEETSAPWSSHGRGASMAVHGSMADYRKWKRDADEGRPSDKSDEGAATRSSTAL